jgi:hypothetical protein
LLSVVIIQSSARYGLNGVYELIVSGGVGAATGVVGCAILLASLYGGFASSLEDLQQRTVLSRSGAAARHARPSRVTSPTRSDPSPKWPASASSRKVRRITVGISDDGHV